MCLIVIGGEISSKMEMVFLFRSRDSFFCKTMGTVTTKQHNCRFLVLKRNNQNVAAGFALFTVVKTSRFYSLKCKHTFHLYMLDNTHLR